MEKFVEKCIKPRHSSTVLTYSTSKAPVSQIAAAENGKMLSAELYGPIFDYSWSDTRADHPVMSLSHATMLVRDPEPDWGVISH
jgi:hypothetical protein